MTCVTWLERHLRSDMIADWLCDLTQCPPHTPRIIMFAEAAPCYCCKSYILHILSTCKPTCPICLSFRARWTAAPLFLLLRPIKQFSWYYKADKKQMNLRICLLFSRFYRKVQSDFEGMFNSSFLSYLRSQEVMKEMFRLEINVGIAKMQHLLSLEHGLRNVCSAHDPVCLVHRHFAKTHKAAIHQLICHFAIYKLATEKGTKCDLWKIRTSRRRCGQPLMRRLSAMIQSMHLQWANWGKFTNVRLKVRILLEDECTSHHTEADWRVHVELVAVEWGMQRDW